MGEREAAFAKTDIYKAALDFGLPTAMPQIEQRVGQLLRQGQLLKGKGADRHLVTTADALAAEQRILASVDHGRGAAPAVVSTDVAGDRLQADGVLALFPAWFAQPQPDWPANLLQWTFPLEDLATEQTLQPELQAFLASGERPVIFTPGSANVQASRFFAVAAEAVKRIGCRAVFVTREPKQVPPNLPASILTVEYAPFSTLLKHAAVFVHHGGIGTLSQGFAAGVPQLIMAMAHDQPDNADRLERLGAGTGLSVRQFTPERVTQELQHLLYGEATHQSVQDCTAKLRQTPSPEVLVEWIEARMKSRSRPFDDSKDA
ncbi:MAG: hypothetical protein B7Z26_05865 [Asticcacaulis sp. 32-58-5]|nr:MAG: hypothetical protein B7Z26_05865 [Asticcacaulis sp. 32-58-5]